MSERSMWRRSARRLRVIHEHTDAALDRARIEAESGRKVACIAGCAHCCRQLVTVSMPEAIALALHLLSDRPLLQRVHARAQEQVRALLSTSISHVEWFELQLACPLLESERCTAYEWRPTACRTLVALDTPEHCVHGAADPNVLRVDASEVSSVVIPALLALSVELRLPLGPAPLPVALTWALIVVQHGLAELRRQLAGTPFEDELQALTYWATRMHGREATSAVLAARVGR